MSKHRRKRPAGLPRPYEYVLSLKELTLLYELLSGLTPQFAPVTKFYAVSKTPIKHGVVLDVRTVAHAARVRRDQFGDPLERPITKTAWRELTERTQTLLLVMLGKDAVVRADPFKTTGMFSLSFSAYIAYHERFPDVRNYPET